MILGSVSKLVFTAWVTGVKRSEPPKKQQSVASLRSTTAILVGV